MSSETTAVTCGFIYFFFVFILQMNPLVLILVSQFIEISSALHIYIVCPTNGPQTLTDNSLPNHKICVMIANLFW